jgi:hypothetical protein
MFVHKELDKPKFEGEVICPSGQQSSTHPSPS